MAEMADPMQIKKEEEEEEPRDKQEKVAQHINTHSHSQTNDSGDLSRRKKGTEENPEPERHF